MCMFFTELNSVLLGVPNVAEAIAIAIVYKIRGREKRSAVRLACDTKHLPRRCAIQKILA